MNFKLANVIKEGGNGEGKDGKVEEWKNGRMEFGNVTIWKIVNGRSGTRGNRIGTVKYMKSKRFQSNIFHACKKGQTGYKP